MTNKVDFDDYTENYNELLKDGTSFFSPSEEYFAEYKVNLVRRRAAAAAGAPVKRLLEFGCGIGRNISFLKKAFPEAIIVGSDISPASLEIAKRENEGVEFFCENDDLKFSEPFDLIFVAGVFHHVAIEQRSGIANTLFKRLAPGGSLFVFEHNPYNPVTRRIVKNCPFDEDAILVRPSELKRILKEAELDVEESGYCLFVPPRFSKLVALESLLSWLPLGGQQWVQARRPS